MTPGARIKAATEILEHLARTNEPADRYLKSWGSRNRFAGSKDRRFLRELTYDALRHRASYAQAMGDDSPRALALAAMRWGQDLALDALAEVCTGEGHNAASLSDAERSALEADAAPDVLEWPTWTLDELARGRGEDEKSAIAKALNETAPVDLRVNVAKAKRDDVLAALEAVGFGAKPARFSPAGIRVARKQGEMQGQNIRALPLFRDGRIEIQDEGSQLVALLAGVKPGMQVIDLCAGGGGKTLVLGNALEGSGQLFACDINETRLKAGQERVRRAGLHVVQPKLIAPWDPTQGGTDPDLEELAGKADLVFLDVPCSGSGAWRRQPDGKWNLTLEKLDEFVATQAAILRRGAQLVKPGGRLVYVTCSVFERENADQIRGFRQQTDEFEIEKISALWESAISKPFPKALDAGFVEGGFLQLSPNISGTDGFFVAVLTRKK